MTITPSAQNQSRLLSFSSYSRADHSNLSFDVSCGSTRLIIPTNMGLCLMRCVLSSRAREIRTQTNFKDLVVLL